MSRDLNELDSMGLIRRVGRNNHLVMVNYEIIRAFLPHRAATNTEQ